MGCDCPDTTSEFNLSYIIVNIFYYNKDSLFYSYVIQIVLVFYGYHRFGKGKYWKTLLIASTTGIIGAVLEKFCVVWTDHPDNQNAKLIYLLLLINEPFWIITEFSIPYLNMVKLKAVLRKDKEKMLKIFTLITFILFSCFRFRIGYLRFTQHTVFNNDIFHAHGYAFATMAITEFVCSIFILKKMTKDYKRAKDRGLNGSLYDYSRKSSLTILLLIDIIGFILAFLSLFSNSTLEKILKPFHCLKSNSILILTFDTLIFKLNAKIHGQTSSNPSSSNYGASISGNYNSSSMFSSNIKKESPKIDTEKLGISNDPHLNNIPNFAYIQSSATTSNSSLPSMSMTNYTNYTNVNRNNNATRNI